MRIVRAVGLSLALAAPCSAQSYLVVVCGLGGEEQYREAFYQWGVSLVEAAARLGIPPSDIFFLAETPERDRRIVGPPTKAQVEQILRRLSQQRDSALSLWVVLIGHGSDRGEPRFSLPGPDLSAVDLKRMLEPWEQSRVAVINAASASGGFLPVLSRPGWVVVTATRSGFEQNQTVFPQFFVEAFARQVADLDKDGRVSLLEAFVHARESVRRHYQNEGRLLTEHAMLDDNGDGEGSDLPAESSKDGALAARTFLAPAVEPVAVADSELALLLKKRDSLDWEIARLKSFRGSLSQEEYERQLEALLVELALVDRAIGIRGGRRP